MYYTYKASSHLGKDLKALKYNNSTSEAPYSLQY